MKTKLQKLLIVIAGLLVSNWAYAFEVDGYFFKIESSSNRTVSIVKGPYNFGIVGGKAILPSTIVYNNIEYTVVAIDNEAFRQCTTLKSIVIPPTITSIRQSAFYYCINLEEVEMLDGVEDISFSFNNRSGYTNPIFEDANIKTLYLGRNIACGKSYTSPFNGQQIINLTISEAVTSLPMNFMYGNDSIKTIKFPHRLSKIGKEAFYGCSNIEEIYLPDSILTIEEETFMNCSKLSKVFIGNGLTELADDMFYGCENLSEVYLGNSVKTISDLCFYNCNNLTNVYLFSDVLTTLGKNAIPTTVSRIYVPNTARYENLLNGYYTENLLTIYESETEYTGKVPELSFKNNVEGMNVTFDAETTPTDAGKYSTEVKAIFCNDDWSTSINAPCTYTITKAPVTVIANDVKREYGKENPEFTCSYFGFKNNETDSVLITKPTIATTATAESNVGTYPIIASSAEAKNYTFTYERGTLTITQASQAIEWEQTFEDVTVGDQLQLSATATSGLEVKYSVSDESIAEIYTSNGATFLDCLKAGDVTIKVNQSGDDNWAAADRVTKTITIKPKSGIENVAIPETDELSLTILSNDIVVNNAVRSSVEVYSISGATIYSTQDYNGETISLSNGAYIVKVGNKTRKVVL